MQVLTNPSEHILVLVRTSATNLLIEFTFARSLFSNNSFNIIISTCNLFSSPFFFESNELYNDFLTEYISTGILTINFDEYDASSMASDIVSVSDASKVLATLFILFF